MPATERSKGRWIHRFAIHFFTVVLGVLVYWLLGFLVEDIQSLPGPEYPPIERRHVDKGLLDRHDELTREVQELDRRIGHDRERQRILKDSSGNLEQTIEQIRKAGTPTSPKEEAALADTMALFLESQRRYQELNQTIAERVERQDARVREKEEAAAGIAKGREAAHREHAGLRERHRLRIAFLQLGILLPILAAAGLALLKKRGSLYAPLFFAFGGATLLMVTEVIHDYFPSRYFKYILTLALVAVVCRLLIHFIRAIRAPKTEWLVKQYREAYERFLCPICEYPIRTGPRRFLYWTRRTVTKTGLPNGQGAVEEEPYTCPACGNGLFEPCGVCRKVRHALLPHCAHCGAEKQAA